MTPRQKAIRDYLEKHCAGRDHGKPYHELIWAVRFTGSACSSIKLRELRENISALVLAGSPIGSSRKHGIYWCRNTDDYRTALATLADEAYPTMRRLEALKRTIRRLAQTELV